MPTVEQMQPRAGRHLAVGAQHHLPVVLGHNREPERARRLQFLQHQRQHGRPERAGDVFDRARCRPARPSRG